MASGVRSGGNGPAGNGGSRPARWWVAAAVTLSLVLGGSAWSLWASGRTGAEPTARAAAHAAAGLGSTGATAAGPAFPVPRATCRNAPAGWQTVEWSRPGTDQVPTIAPARLGSIQGYLDAGAAQCGQRIGVHLAATSLTRATAQVTALRIGAYRGGNARAVWSTDVVVGSEPAPRLIGPRTTVLARWPVALWLRPSASWPPGMYLVRVCPIGHRADASYLPLRVQTSGVHAPRLVIGSELTQLAYNSFGGVSLYGGPAPTHSLGEAARAYVAASDRPLSGAGLAHLFTMDLTLAELLDQHRLAADWTSDSSLDLDPGQVAGYASLVLPGHSEYWTRRMYDAVQHAVDNGTNLAVLGGNELYWQARVQRDPGGRMVAMTVYRSARIDPVADRSLVTVQWRQPPLHRDPAALTGNGMSGVDVYGPLTVTSTPSWLFDGVPVPVGTSVPDVVGNESDGVEPPGGHSPANVQVILDGRLHARSSPTPVRVSTVYHVASSGAGVFDAGTTYWLCGTQASCPTRATPPATQRLLTGLTVNALTAFAVPDFGGGQDGGGSWA